MTDFTKVTGKNDVQPGKMMPFIIKGINIALVNVNGKIYAFEDKCPHMGAKLSNGFLIDNILTCMVHGARFDVTTGVPDSITDKKLKMFEVKIEGDEIFVNV